MLLYTKEEKIEKKNIKMYEFSTIGERLWFRTFPQVYIREAHET